MIDILLNSNAPIASALAWATQPFTYYLYSVVAGAGLIVIATVSSIRLASRKRKLLGQFVTAQSKVIESSNSVEFTEQYSLLNEQLRELNAISRAWEEFTETLIEPNTVDENSPYDTYHNTKRPTEFFNADALLEEIEPRFKPEQYIGFGLILTFLGLVAALVEAGPAFSSGGTEISDALEKLISTAGAKFIASIGGLFAALFLGIRIEATRVSIRQHVDQFCDSLESRMEFASAERIAAHQYGYSVRQAKSLEDLGNNMAVAIGEKISDAMREMPGLVTTAMQPVTDELRSVVGSLGDSGTDQMAAIAQQVSNQISGAGEDSMNRMLRQLDALSESMTTTVASLNETAQTMKSSLTGSAAQAAETLGSTTDEIAGAVSRALADLSSNQQQMNVAMQDLVMQLKGGATEFDEKLTETREASTKQLTDIMESINQKLVDSADNAAQQMGDTVSNTISAGAKQTAAELTKATNAITSGIEAPMSAMQTSLDSLADKTASVVSSLESVNSQLGAHRDGIATANAQLGTTAKTLADASTAVSQAANPLRDAANSASSAASKLLDATAESQDKMAGYSGRMAAAIEDANRVLEDLNRSWESQAGLLKGADEGLEKAFKQINANLESSLRNLEQFNTQSWDNMRESLDAMVGITEQLTDAVEDLDKARRG